jgi:hypothetical protein
MAFIVKEGTAGFEGTDEATQKLILEGLEKSGFVVRTQDQEKSYLSTYAQRQVDEAFSKRNMQLEQTIKELTGVEKADAQEKYYDYFKRSLSIKLGDVEKLQAKIKEYEAKGADGNTIASEYKKQLEALQAQINNTRKEYEEKLSAKDKALFDTKIKSLTNATIDKLKANFNDTLSDSLLEDVIAARINKFESEYTPKDIEGVTVFYDKKGEPILSKKDGKPISMEEIFTDLFQPYMDEKKVQKGAGSSKGQKKEDNQQQASWKDKQLPPEVKSKVALTKWLSTDLKMSEDSKEFAEAFTELGKALPLR